MNLRAPSQIKKFGHEWSTFLEKVFTSATWGTIPTFSNSWQAAGGATLTPAIRKTTLGEVQLRGAISTGTGGAVAFTVPSGYAPTGTIGFNCHGSLVTINSSGQVIPATSATVYLDNIHYEV